MRPIIPNAPANDINTAIVIHIILYQIECIILCMCCRTLNFVHLPFLLCCLSKYSSAAIITSRDPINNKETIAVVIITISICWLSPLASSEIMICSKHLHAWGQRVIVYYVASI